MPVNPGAARSVVVAPRRVLLADQQQHGVVPPLERRPGAGVVVGQDDDIDSGALPGGDDLRDRPGAVRMRRVEVYDAGEVVQ
jgi:hypothetical protein